MSAGHSYDRQLVRQPRIYEFAVGAKQTCERSNSDRGEASEHDEDNVIQVRRITASEEWTFVMIQPDLINSLRA